MAVKTSLADSCLPESVKEAVKSTTTCTASTVASLQSLLRSTTKPASSEKARSNSKSTKATASTVTRTKSTRSVNPKIAAKVAVFQPSATDIKGDEETQQLSVQDRLVLATEVFNAVSRALSDALQISASQHNGKSPLKPASPNQQMVIAPTIKLKTSKSSSGTSEQSSADGLVAAAECASLALASLRTLKNDKAGSDAYPNLQLEQGTCVLAGRLIALGLNNMAYRELKALKRRLQEFIQSRAGNNSSKASVSRPVEDTSVTETAADLLLLENVEHAGPVLSALVPFQTNVLKLVISEAKVSNVEKASSALAISNPSSPAKIILQSLEAKILDKDKAALQLVSLSNTISSLATLSQKSIAANPATKKFNTRSLSTLTLQLLSMEVRTMSWELSGHIPDLKREFWDPLLRFLETFSNNGSKIQRSDFVSIYRTVQRLQSKGTNDSMSTIAFPWKIASVLGRIAQDASCLEEALKLFSNAIESAEVEQPLAVSIIQCRIAFIHLCLCRNIKDYSPSLVANSLVTAATGLKSPNKGSSHELEELVVESAKLKKLTMASFGDSFSSNSNPKDDIVNPTVEFLHAFIRFLRRYIGRQVQDKDDETSKIQAQAVLCRLKNIILSAVDSSVALGKTAVLRQIPPWETVQPVLSDSRRLLSNLENLDEHSLDDGNSWKASTVKLSNVYWSRYLKEKEAGQGYKELIPLLDQSANLLQNCPVAERVAGFAALKFERLAHLYLEARMGAKSLSCFQRSIQEHIDCGVLQQYMAYLSGKPPVNPLNDSQSPGFILGRVLSSYLKMQIRRPDNDEKYVFDNKSLPSEERGILLEWQIAIITGSHGLDSDTDHFRELFQMLISELLSLYSLEIYPIRRLRVIRFILRFLLDHPNSADNVVTETLTKGASSNVFKSKTSEKDAMLEPFVLHIQNSLRLALSFYDDDIEINRLGDTIASWTFMMRNCTTWDTLNSVVDDCEHWIAQLKAASDYFDARGFWKLYLAASELLIHIFELQPVPDESSMLLILSRCALQYCRRGDCNSALYLLDRAKKYADTHSVDNQSSVAYQLARSEYYLEIGNPDLSETALSSAQQLYQDRENGTDVGGNRSHSKVVWERLVVDGTLLFSRIAYYRQNLEVALYHAKLSVRLSTRIWAKLEHLSEKKRESGQLTKEISEMDLVIDGVANMEISSASASSACSYREGAVYWNHVASHNECFLNLMRLSAYNGLFQDAIYYGEQALKVNKALGAPLRLIACQAELGLEWIRGNHLSEAKEVLNAAPYSSENLLNNLEVVKLKISLAALSKGHGEHKEALRLLEEAGVLLGRASEVKPDSLFSVKPTNSSLEDKMADLKIRQASVLKETELLPNRRPRKTRATPKSTTKATEDVVLPKPAVHSQSIIALKNEIFRQQVVNLLAVQDLDQASKLLENLRESPSTTSQISIQIEEIEHLLADAMRSIATHAVYCVLPESTLSVPSIEAVIDAMTSPANKQTAPVKRSKSTAKEPRGRAAKTAKKEIDIGSIMSQAKSAISETVRKAVASGSTMEGHAASCLMGRISMLLHATKPGVIDKDILTPVNANELGRITAFDRERLAISLDKKLSGNVDSMNWPTSTCYVLEEKMDIITNFSRDYVDILPCDWNVLSISLNSDHTEFIISRMSRDSTPFLLRLPLKRSDEGDESEDDFTFDWGKNEMKEIIKLANASAHDAKTRIDRQSKKDWWTTRESLDRRLETLLENIENVWLGGFRGIFDPTPRDPERLSRFAASFETILDKHLPSRRKQGSRKEKIKIHENVLGLFVGLKGLDKQENPEDSLMDLLYFVVDILQFQGERNAYDEIDFDMMVVDTLDVLNSYNSSASQDIQHPNHTILVLDKSLHSFPWESLPCLQGLPVSRMPSLECLRERIVQFRRAMGEESSQIFHIDRNNGTSVLNPSGDLKTTQSTFENTLSNLNGWSSITEREPTEAEFKSALESKSLFLYFGHGSGAQYIRGRTIKRLDKCAVAFLMGCSSGCLTETGELEPYGTPMNYMQAGSPALVATLWDVTDKDIDRFAKCAFQKWGLIGPDECENDQEITKRKDSSKSKKSSKGKEPARAESSLEGNCALDEAIAMSRNSCLLKYLNGAAPVIYGIPIYLNR
ncbi:putative separin [Talaromyces proteolyticus]|uniref:separase n=1 Tax=Talaromyces proteolyticus TaxID=1131652 RepID=A0AAD4KTV1_9EURO|nr:putative separin [Talaromyces proteolyticus]KAH8700767.1 putative separin [Talaromyces proteolyticus]